MDAAKKAEDETWRPSEVITESGAGKTGQARGTGRGNTVGKVYRAEQLV